MISFMVTSTRVKQSFDKRAKRLGISPVTTEKAHSSSTSSNKKSELYSLLRGKKFWYSFDKDEHQKEFLRTYGNCCYMHITGLFKDRNDQPRPIYPWQEMILQALTQHKYIFWKKSVGIGATSLLLAWASWLCTRDDCMRDKEIAVVVGPNLFLAQGLIARVRQPYLNRGILLRGNSTSVVLNGCTWTAYPSNHLDSLRSRINLKGIFCDEADFFQPQERSILRDVIERYISKSDPWIWLVSTVAKSHGLFYQIEREPQETCLYHRITTDYRFGLGTIYGQKSVDRMRVSSPAFSREMECLYSGAEGNVFSGRSIDYAVKLGEEVNLTAAAAKTPFEKYVGIDPAFGGGSNTGITVTQLSESGDKVEVIYSKELVRPTLGQIVSEVLFIVRNFSNVQKIFIDDSSAVVARELKLEFGERLDWATELNELRKERGFTDDQILQFCDWIRIFPINFRQTRKEMLWRVKRLLDEGMLKIPEQFERLIISLRTAVAVDGALDKSSTSGTEFSDSLDSLQLSCCGYTIIGTDRANDNNEDSDTFVYRTVTNNGDIARITHDQ